MHSRTMGATLAVCAVTALAVLGESAARVSGQAPTGGVTAFEGARLITGD